MSQKKVEHEVSVSDSVTQKHHQTLVITQTQMLQPVCILPSLPVIILLLTLLSSELFRHNVKYIEVEVTAAKGGPMCQTGQTHFYHSEIKYRIYFF